MTVYALDSSAVLRFVDEEAGVDEVDSILDRMQTGEVRVIVCALHWGEIAGQLYRKRGARVQQQVLDMLRGLGIEMIDASAARAVRAATIQAEMKIPYVDAFGVELAESIPCTFVTADYDLKPAARDVKILFLPKK